KLREFVPPTVPCTLLQPGVDPDYLRPLKADPELRRSLGLAENEKIVVFTGSNTFANEPDMRELYVAIRILNQRGVPARLVRTGFNRPEFLEGLSPDLRAHVLDLGFISKARLPGLVSIADVLVQPGRPGPFNDYRLPSKLPEYLASGRPVVLPPTNIALEMRDGVDALFLASGAPENIADCCERILRDPALAASLGRGGSAFARRHFDLGANTSRLLEVYGRVLGRPPKACWGVIRGSSASDLTAAAEELAAGINAGAVTDDLKKLADDLAAIGRLEDERECGALQVREKVRLRLEETVRHLELQRDLTSQHARNLEEKVQSQENHAKLQKKLTDRHIQNLESRITSIERMARAEAEKASRAAVETAKASSELTQAWAEHKRLVARILEMDAELKAREQRLKATFRSLSWRITAPVRDLQKLMGRIGAKSRPAPAPSPPTPPAQPAAKPEAAPAQVPSPAPVVHHYTYNFDHPRNWTTASNKLLILGWCYENAAAPILGIRAHFAGKTYEGIYGSKRLDVLA